MKKRFSLKNKLVIIFGLLIAVASLVEGLLAVQTARKAVTEKEEDHLIDKATDVAEVVNGRLESFFPFAEGIARMPVLRDANTPAREKTAFLAQEVSEITQKNQQPRRKRRGIKPSARIRGRLGIWRPRWGNSKDNLGTGRHFFRITEFFPSLDPILSSKEPLS